MEIFNVKVVCKKRRHIIIKVAEDFYPGCIINVGIMPEFNSANLFTL